MDDLFYKWFYDNRTKLNNKGIQTEEITKSPPNPNPSVSADHTTETYMGRVTVWKSGLIDVEILDQCSAKRVYYKHFEITDENPNEEYLLGDYFQKLLS
jgi:hypothetical protein